ncbi:nucleoid-associated protein [Plantibacter sp. Leaf314]|uniref:nucleoid-associated protein n=1 Tax=Plantibacter sp. Leaf314 TaxID=1736333 RepID=UPI0009E78B86|nr:nucleoid-associated protein [Plantibacter sp. Leaf314]
MPIRIRRAIIHEIPKGRYSADDSSRVSLSYSETALQVETRRFIEENMLDFSLRHPRLIIEDDVLGGSLPDHIREILGDHDTLVPASQSLAELLHQSQTGNSPSGILIVAIVEDGSTVSVAILKAEHQEGMRLKRDESGEADHFDLEHLNELIVGNSSRVYKIAILNDDSGSIDGQMVDQQNGVAFADFFLTSFLGCKLADDAEVRTKQFMDSALSFVNERVSSPELKARYAGAIVSYMQTPADSFQAVEFADQFLEIDDRDDFLAALPDAVSSAVIPKDLSLVVGHGSGLRFVGPGVVITASSEALESGAIQVETDVSTGVTTIIVRGDVRKVSFGSAPKS